MVKGLNVTCDNFLTKYPLAQTLKAKQMSLVGTVRKNRRELPIIPQLSRNEQGYLFSNGVTLLNYAPKKIKTVLLFSTLHFSHDILQISELPEIIQYYNKTKGGVDTLDMMGQNYTVKRISNRWPVTIFYHIIDMALMNAFNVFIEVFPEFFKYRKNTRRHFIDAVAISLIESAGEPAVEEPSVQVENPPMRRRCDDCPRSKDKKFNKICDHCSKTLCMDHRLIICSDCMNKI